MQQQALLTTSRVISSARLARQMQWRPKNAAALCVWVGDKTTATSVAVGFHPSQRKAPQQLLSLTATRTPGRKSNRATTNDTIQSLQAALSQFPHLPLIVGWPVQPEGGACGAACGRVLHVLDRLQQHGSTTVSLYSPAATRPPPDAFGRDPAYNRTSHKQCHVASQEQYNQHALEGVETAADLWRTVCSDVWEEHEQEHHQGEADESWSRAETTAALLSSSSSPTLVQRV